MAATLLDSWSATDIANTATVVVTVDSVVPVGSRVVVVCNRSCLTTTSTTLSCADSRGNTYVLDAAAVRSATHIFGILSAPVTTALQVGDTITVTGAATTRKAMVAAAWSGLGAPLGTSGTTVGADASTNAGPNGNTALVTALASPGATGLVVSGASRAGTATLVTRYGSTVAGQAMTTVGSGDRGCALAYRSDPHPEPQPGSWTLSVAQGWSAGTVTYEIVGGLPPIAATLSVTVGGEKKAIVAESVIVGGVKRPVVARYVIIGGEKIHAGPLELPVPTPLTYAAEVLADTPLAYYRLGEASPGLPQDSSGNAHHAASRGSSSPAVAGLVTGDPDGAISFSGSGTSVGNDVRVTSAAWMGPASAITVEALFNPSSVAGEAAIVGRYYFGGAAGSFQSWGLSRFGDALRVRVAVNNSSTVRIVTSPAGTIAVGETYHVAFTYDLTILRLFINGDVVASAIFSDTTMNQGGIHPLQIASQPTSNTGQFIGRIDEVAIYGTALPMDRIREHYWAAIGGQPALTYKDEVLADTPLVYWRLGEPVGATTAEDRSGNARNGAIGSVLVKGATGLLTGDTDKAISGPGTTSSATTHAVGLALGSWMQPPVASGEVWVKPTDVTAGDRIIVGRYALGGTNNAANRSWHLTQNGTTAYVTIATGESNLFVTANHPTALAAGVATYLAWTYDGANLKLYVNGALAATTPQTGNLNVGTLPLQMACNNGINANKFIGTIDEFAFYDHPLSAARIAAHYAVGTNAAPLITASVSLTASSTLTATASSALVYSAAVMTDSPLAYWPLNESSGTTMADASGNSRNGTIDAGVTLAQSGIVPGDAGTAWLLDAADEGGTVTAASWMVPAAALTVEAWVYLTAYDPDGTVVVARSQVGATTSRANKAWALTIGSTGATTGRVYTDGAVTVVPLSAAGVVPLNTLCHLVLVQDGTNVTHYCNGVSVATAALAGVPVSLANNSQPLTVGRTQGTSSTNYSFTGKIQHVAFYGTALSPARIAAHYAAGTP